VQQVECLFHCDKLSTGSIQMLLCYERVRFRRSVNNQICYKSNHSISYHTYIMLWLWGMGNGPKCCMIYIDATCSLFSEEADKFKCVIE